MEHPSPREVALDQTPELGPRHSSTLPSPSERMQPRPRHVLAERVQAVNIARYGVVVEVALDHAPQPTTDHEDRLVHASHQRLANRLEAGTHLLRRGQSLQLEPAVRPGLPTDVSEPEEVERWRLCKPLLGARLGREATELQHARLVLVQRQPELGEPHLHVLKESVHVALALKSENAVVGVPNGKPPAIPS